MMCSLQRDFMRPEAELNLYSDHTKWDITCVFHGMISCFGTTDYITRPIRSLWNINIIPQTVYFPESTSVV